MKNTILGAIVGDVIGSIYEWDNYRAKDFEFCSPKCDFTDDTVMTIAVAKSLMNNEDMSATLKDFGRRYPGRGYGGMFVYWLESENTKPYNSFGNGSAMRTSAAGFMAKNLSEAMILAEQSAIVTHNHSEGIKGAQATAVAIYLAKSGFDKDYIRDYITTTFEYNLDFTCDEIRDSYIFNETTFFISFTKIFLFIFSGLIYITKSFAIFLLNVPC